MRKIPRFRGLFLSLTLPVLIPLLFLMSLRLACPNGFELEPDSFYHVAMADLGAAFCMGGSFPELTLSVWSNQFSDKELGFHLLLSGIRFWQDRVGLDLGPPFHFPALFLDGMLLLAFAFACREFRVRRAWFFMVLLVAVYPEFSFRLLMLRPHVLAICLVLLSFALFHRIMAPRGLLLAAAAGFAMAWCYSNPHFLLVPAVAVAVGRLLSKDRASRRTLLGIPAAVAAGIALGYAVHPQFPHTFSIWWTQCVDVVFQALFPSGGVLLGGELASRGWEGILWCVAGFAAFGFAVAVAMRLASAGVRDSALLSSTMTAGFFGMLQCSKVAQASRLRN